MTWPRFGTMPQARTRTSTSNGAGLGVGTSSITIGAPTSCILAARIVSGTTDILLTPLFFELQLPTAYSPSRYTSAGYDRSEEHTSELQVTNAHLVCRLLLEKKKQHTNNIRTD